MNAEHTSEPPEEPHYRNEPHLLSPASPKPIHFPTPTNIPVLEMQMDVGFNQTEAHMSDPAMHNTEVRPDFWRDPNEQQQEGSEDHASPYSTGGEAAEAAQEDTDGAESEAVHVPTEGAADSEGTTANAPDPQSDLLSNEHTKVEADTAPEAAATDVQLPFPQTHNPATTGDVAAQSGDSQTLSVEIHPEQAQNAPAFDHSSSVDVQVLLHTLQTNPITNNNTNSPAQGQPSESDLETSPPSAAGLSAPPSGLPPRPPPQEQPLIHPHYVHSNHISDYHPHAAHPALQPAQGHARAASQGTVADSNSHNHVSAVGISPSSANSSGAAPPSAGIPGAFSHTQQTSPTSATPSAQGQAFHTPTSATQPFAANTPIESRRERAIAAGQTPTAEDRPWDASVQRKYDGFIEAERGYVSEGRWEQFPQGSRLFVGKHHQT